MSIKSKQVHCESYCEHGGICTLFEGHEGKHDSKYCQWTDDQAISKEQADHLYCEKEPELGKCIIQLTDLFRYLEERDH